MVSPSSLKVTPPKHGLYWRRNGDRADGTFYVGKRRVRQLLALFSKVARTAQGRKRTEAQVTAELRRLWHVHAAELQAELDSQVGENRPISVVFQEWHEQREAHGLAPATLKLQHKMVAANWKEAVGDHPLSEMGLSKIDRFTKWLRAKKLAPATVNLRLMKLRTFLNWCRKRGYLAAVPEIERVDEPSKVPMAPDAAQIRRLFDRIHKLMRKAKRDNLKYQYELHELALVLAPCTAMRRGEMTRLEWGHVNLDRGLIHLVDTKEGQDKIVAIADVGVQYLRQRRRKYPDHVYVFQAFALGPNDTPLLAYPDPHALTTAGRRHMAQLKIKGWKPWHGFRTFFATVGLDDLGIDAQAVSAQLGHASTSTTERHYQSSRTKSKLRAVKAMDSTVRRVFGPRVGRAIAAKRKKITASKR